MGSHLKTWQVLNSLFYYENPEKLSYEMFLLGDETCMAGGEFRPDAIFVILLLISRQGLVDYRMATIGLID